MRAKYGAVGAFVDVYDKTRPEMDVWAWKKEEEGWPGAGFDVIRDVTSLH